MRLPSISALPAMLLTLLLGGCFFPAQSRFSPDVAAALRDEPMRRIETESLFVYYPEKRREDALRIAERVEGCAAVLRSQAKIHNSYADQKMTIVIPDMPFNNAYVAPSIFGAESLSVIPTSNTFDFASELGVPPDPSYVGCHEVVHYVHLLQASGVWGWMNRYFGDTLSPQLGLGFWFLEGLATYYESRLQPGTGRMAWPAWRGVFHAGFAEKRVNGGDLSTFQRPFHFGHHYLVGSHFVEFLAKRYGEEALWKLIDIQGDSILFPFGVALRFKAATGKSLPALVDEFANAVEKHFPVRPTPSNQVTIRDGGSAARYAIATSGREALLQAGPDQTPVLRIYEKGKLIRERELVDILPPRKLVTAHPILSSGLSFTADGKELYFVAIDAGPLFQESRLMRYHVDQDKLEVLVANLGGTGGGITGDGKTYYYAYADGDRRHLAALDVQSGTSKIIRDAGPRAYYDHARPSPDGSRLASALFDGEKFVIEIMRAEYGRTEVRVPFTGAVHDPSWIDNNRVLFLGEHEGRFQVHIYHLDEATVQRISDAPYLAFQPRALGEKVRFLNRKGWRWTLDEIALPPAPKAENAVAATTASPPATAASNVPTLASKAPSPTTANHPIKILSDEPYSQTDSLFYPRFRTPLFIGGSEGAFLLGMQLSGGDPLGFHRWAAFAQYNFEGEHVSGGVHYVNAMLAPLELRAELEHYKWNEILDDDESMASKGPLHVETRGLLSIGRSIRTSRIDLAAIALDEEDPGNIVPAHRERRLAGPGLFLQHGALRGTAYAGALKGYVLGASATHYNESLSSLDVSLSDLGGQLNLFTPLPLNQRHTLSLGLRGRRLIGLDRDESFLVVGGDTSAAELWRNSDKDDPDELNLPTPEPLTTFQEPLRGFEDLEFSTDRVAIADLVYHLPVILDFGISSTAYLLPGIFFRQLEFEVFGTGATDSFASFEDHRHLAAGVSGALAMSFWLVPMRFRYQLAQRFTDDEALAHSISLGFAL